ncbi:MAG: adventurous gliding motility protein S [Oligoflexia bacterium]|nr:adventurous gliding motility protein S [Oligoflexia bacterium]
MPIYVPGKRWKGRQKALGTKRNVVAVLQLTAMVDMFTVLVVFLLQNYASTNQILPISDQIALPQASTVKELKPSFVVVLSKDSLSFNKQPVGTYNDVKNSQDWLIVSLLESVQEAIEILNQENKSVSRKDESGGDVVPLQYKMTLQADKDIDFLSIKKVLYTLTEAGVQEVNFAVIKVRAEDKYGVL